MASSHASLIGQKYTVAERDTRQKQEKEKKKKQEEQEILVTNCIAGY